MVDQRFVALDAAWAAARGAGALGQASIEELISHTAGYVSAVCRVLGEEAPQIDGTGIDVGTGAGVPGVLLADAFPLMTWRLVDASEKRCGWARAAARALGVHDRVSVHHDRAEDLGSALGWMGGSDLAVARLLGPPAEAAELLVPLVRQGGLVVVSADQAGEQAWCQADLACLGAEVVDVAGGSGSRFVVVRRCGEMTASFPRRASQRRRAPLF